MKRQTLIFAAAFALGACAGRPAPTAAPAPTRAPAAAAAAAPAPAPATLRYAVGTGRYRFESRAHVEQEMMGQVNAADATTAALVTAVVAEAQGNLGVSLTIDSLGVTAPIGGVDDAQLAAARGKTVRLVFSPSGQVISLTPPDSTSPVVQQIMQGLRGFLPPLPPGAIASGTTWTDTVSSTSPSSGMQVTLRSVRQHRVAGWEDRGGTRALHITSTSTYTVSGSGEVQGQQIELAGGGQSTAEHYVSAGGVFLESAVSDSALINANVVSAGIVVPVRQRTRSTITRLP